MYVIFLWDVFNLNWLNSLIVFALLFWNIYFLGFVLQFDFQFCRKALLYFLLLFIKNT